MTFSEMIEKYGLIAYGITILFGGLIGVKYMPSAWAQKYRFLLFSLIVAILFAGVEIFVEKSFQPQNATKYITTFCITAVAYQYALRNIFQKWGWIDKEIDESAK